MYSEEFKEFVKSGMDNQYFVGTGNPNANILFIGKESNILPANIWYRNNAKDWFNHIENNSYETLSYPVHKKGEKNANGSTYEEDHMLLKSWGKNTWSKYQKLGNFIFNKEEISRHIDFLENVFTTEINDSPNKNTSTANKSKLNDRKLLFKESNYIQNFPVIVLACSNYIRNNDENREIDEIFGVNFKEEYPQKVYNKTNWFYSHFNDDKTKLVIHTRQLSADVKTELLKDMGLVIREHLNTLKHTK